MTLKEIKDFIRIQGDFWSLCRDNYAALSSMQVKELHDENGSRVVTLLHNPARIKSSTAGSPEDRVCFLCAKARPQGQITVYHNAYDILVNPYPVFPVHLTIAHVNHIPQTIADHIKAMLEISEFLPDLTVFYNGPKCGASAPDHHHFQAAQFDFDEATVASRGIIIKGKNTDEILEKWNKVYDLLPSQEPEPMMNILLNKLPDGGYRLIIIPRKRHRPSCYGQVIVSPASVEMAGYLVTPRREDFENITADKAKEIIEEVTYNNQEIKDICNRL